LIPKSDVMNSAISVALASRLIAQDTITMKIGIIERIKPCKTSHTTSQGSMASKGGFAGVLVKTGSQVRSHSGRGVVRYVLIRALNESIVAKADVRSSDANVITPTMAEVLYAE
jgi:hypothetical protein